MEKKKKELNMIGVVSTEGYEADNRVYHRLGGVSYVNGWKCTRKDNKRY